MTTTHQGFAAILRFVLGDHAHRRTYKRPDNKIAFAFAFEFGDSENEAKELKKLFFSREGLAVSDARELLECNRAVGKTVGACVKTGEWRNSEL